MKTTNAWFGALLALSACDSATSSVGDDVTDQTPLVLLEGPELVSCQVVKGDSSDPFFRVDEVVCTLAAENAFPLQPSGIHVSIEGAKGHAGDKILERAGEASATIARVHADAYPLQVQITATYGVSDAGDLIGLGAGGFFRGFDTVHEVKAPTTDVFGARFPFDLWPIEIRTTTSRFSAELDPYAIDLAPFRSSDKPTLDAAVRVGELSEGQRKSYLLPVSRGASRLVGKGTFGGVEKPIEITGPGRYVAEDAGLRGATDDDLNDVSAGPVIASCWTTPAAEAGKVDVVCKRAAVPGVGFSALETALGPELAGAAPGAPIDEGEGNVVATVDAASLPVVVWARAKITLPPEGIVGIADWQANTPLDLSTTLTADSSAAAPASLSLPFDVWPIAIDATAGGFLCDLDPYTVSMAIAWAQTSVIKVEGQTTPFVNEGETKTFFLAADSRSAAITCKGMVLTNAGNVVENLPVELVRGGSYRVTATGLDVVMPPSP